MRNKKVIIVTIIVIAICTIVVLIIVNRNPRRVFARIFGFELPESAQFVEYHYESLSDSLGAKITIAQGDIDNLKQGLFGFFYGEIPKEVEYWGNKYPWWDLDEGNIMLRFMETVGGKKNIFGIGPKSSPIWVFLVRATDGEYYLYIDK